MMMMKIAIIGDRSSIPIRGMIDRIGAMIGSVNWINARETGFWPRGSNHDRTARMTIANSMICKNTLRMLKTRVTFTPW